MSTRLPFRLGAAVAALTLALGACSQETATPLADDVLDRIGAENLTFGLRSYLRTDGIRTGQVVADSAFEFPDSSFTRLYAMEMSLFHENGRDRARIVADSAILHTRTEELTAWGNVVARVLDTGMTIRSPELQYDPTAQQIWSDSSTVIEQGDGSVTRGSSFRSDLEFTNWSLAEPEGTIPRERPGSTSGTGN